MSTREWTTAYDLFFYYFTHNCDIIRTIKDYGLITQGSSKSAYSSKWSSLKKTYPTEYLDAKNAYLEMSGINQVTVLQKVYDIACNAPLDRDKLKALELLMKYRTEIADSSTLSTSNKLLIEVVDTPSEPTLLAEDILYYEDHEFPREEDMT